MMLHFLCCFLLILHIFIRMSTCHSALNVACIMHEHDLNLSIKLVQVIVLGVVVVKDRLIQDYLLRGTVCIDKLVRNTWNILIVLLRLVFMNAKHIPFISVLFFLVAWLVELKDWDGSSLLLNVMQLSLLVNSGAATVASESINSVSTAKYLVNCVTSILIVESILLSQRRLCFLFVRSFFVRLAHDNCPGYFTLLRSVLRVFMFKFLSIRSKSSINSCILKVGLVLLI